MPRHPTSPMDINRIDKAAQERENRKFDLFTAPNTKYSYLQLSFHHLTLGTFYDDFFSHYKLSKSMGMGDKQRIRFEEILWEALREWFCQFNKGLGRHIPKYKEGQLISEKLIGFPYEAFNDFVLNVLNLPKALELFYKKYSKELDKLAESLKPSDTYIKWKRGDL